MPVVNLSVYWPLRSRSAAARSSSVSKARSGPRRWSAASPGVIGSSPKSTGATADRRRDDHCSPVSAPTCWAARRTLRHGQSHCRSASRVRLSALAGGRVALSEALGGVDHYAHWSAIDGRPGPPRASREVVDRTYLTSSIEFSSASVYRREVSRAASTRPEHRSTVPDWS